jgi:hypothetical protein
VSQGLEALVAWAWTTLEEPREGRLSGLEWQVGGQDHGGCLDTGKGPSM